MRKIFDPLTSSNVAGSKEALTVVGRVHWHHKSTVSASTRAVLLPNPSVSARLPSISTTSGTAGGDGNRRDELSANAADASARCGAQNLVQHDFDDRLVLRVLAVSRDGAGKHSPPARKNNLGAASNKTAITSANPNTNFRRARQSLTAHTSNQATEGHASCGLIVASAR